MLQLEYSAILSTFIKLPIAIKIVVLCIFEWLFYTCFTVIENRFAIFSTKTAAKTNMGILNQRISDK